MQTSSGALGFRLMHLIEVNLITAGITSQIEDGSLCMFRPVYDKPSATTLSMRSAAHAIQHGECFRRIYCIEQYDNDGDLMKFNVTLTDEQKKALGEWHLDISHGLHTHSVKGGKKENTHVPFHGSIADMAAAIVAAVKKTD